MRPTAAFRELLAKPGLIVAPGAYDCLSAALIERAGFPVVYMTGAGVSLSQLGYADLGLATLTEMVQSATRIASTVTVPVIADADTGYGGVLNVQRTVRMYERSGVAAMQIEDQESPKRCGHLNEKRVISKDEMVLKIRAAVDARTDRDFVIVVRTDALAVNGWDDAIARGEAYAEAGADVLFIEAIQTKEQAAQVAQHFKVPLLYNYVETGKSPMLSTAELGRMGFKVVIFPATAFLSATRAVEEMLFELRREGTTAHVLDRMSTLHEAFEVGGLSRMLAKDASYAPRDLVKRRVEQSSRQY